MSDNRAEILKATTALFSEQGIAGLNVRAIAARAGVSTIGVYSHFKGKQGLIEALYIDGFEQLGDAVAVANDTDEPEAAILNVVDRYLNFSSHNRWHYALMFDSGSMAYQPSAAAIAAARKAFVQLEQAVARLRLPPLAAEDSAALAFGLWALVHGFVTLRSHLPSSDLGHDDWRARVSAAVRTHLRGIARR